MKSLLLFVGRFLPIALRAASGGAAAAEWGARNGKESSKALGPTHHEADGRKKGYAVCGQLYGVEFFHCSFARALVPLGRVCVLGLW